MYKSNYIFENLYEYDFESCFYNILNNIEYDMTDIPFENKTQRNIMIGYHQRNNFLVKQFLSNSIKRLINLYIMNLKILEDDIIWKQKDGFILTKPLEQVNITLSISYKNHISKLIKSMNKQKILILYSDNTFDLKGLSNKPIDLSFYDLLLNIDFSNRKSVLEGCEYIRYKIYTSNNPRWFIRKSKDDILTIPMKGDYLLQINKSSINNIDVNDIDKNIIYNNYIYPFFQTILLEFNERKRK